MDSILAAEDVGLASRGLAATSWHSDPAIGHSGGLADPRDDDGRWHTLLIRDRNPMLSRPGQ